MPNNKLIVLLILFGFMLDPPLPRSEPTACPWTHEPWNEVYAYYVARDKRFTPQLHFDVASYSGSLYLASYSSRDSDRHVLASYSPRDSDRELQLALARTRAGNFGRMQRALAWLCLWLWPWLCLCLCLRHDNIVVREGMHRAMPLACLWLWLCVALSLPLSKARRHRRERGHACEAEARH